MSLNYLYSQQGFCIMPDYSAEKRVVDSGNALADGIMRSYL
ncbi:hypothetical protein A464_4322 [Salmonella bongori N268-08]|uniref:Uncharacterized protein n=1 Tax=Salmonella bongori N268-08 TaxID=1197719 RepID=S5N3L0_SALBN|nr:hypothetical protein A464_4322 [Salmonella bongori N268-08]